ncbi:MAG TPA: nucleotide disphospho-sugar-binding domain-containing protein [Solirubrobacteraceae bacterium]|nr:nucleotide disphospho-sugar-binding domain-containing protein [Solirubrobacteraceae bacterium]
MRVFQTLLAFSGNAPPQLALTRELVARGHQVRVLAHRAAGARIEGTGAEFVEFRHAPDLDITRRETDVLRDWDARTRFGAGMRARDNLLIAPVLDTARECAELLEGWPADVVLFDWMLLGASVAAERAGVPAVALVHCPYPFPTAGSTPLGAGMRPIEGWVGTMRDNLMRNGARHYFGACVARVNRARREHGLGRLSSLDEYLRGAEAIYVMTAPELDFSSRGELPANVYYVGPAFEPFEREWASPWPEANVDPLVVISFSTSYMNQRALVQRVLDAVGGLRVRALLTAGPALDTSELQLPANARAVAFVPHRTVLPHAALVVTHAGWQTVNAALADGVPIVCVPDGRDQPENAARVVFAGAGVRVRKQASPRKLRKVIAAALADPALKRGAARMAGALAREDGALVVADRLEQLTARSSQRAAV